MRFIIIFLLFYSSYTFAGKEFIAYWRCPTSDVVKHNFTKEDIKVAIDFEKNVIDASKLTDFVDVIIAEKNYDYTRCLNDLVMYLDGELDEKSEYSNELVTKLKQLIDSIRSKTIFYAKENYQKKPPPFLPYSNINYKLNTKENTLISKNIEEQCMLTNDIPDQYYLSKNFLKEVLRPKIKKNKNNKRECYLKLQNSLLKIANAFFQSPKECAQSNFCNEAQSAVAKYVQELGFIFKDVLLVSKKTTSEICTNDFNKFSNMLLAKKEELEKITSCIELDKNSNVRVVKKNSDSSSFKITRVDDKTHVITLNFIFSQKNEETLKKVNECFNENKDKFRDKFDNKLIFSIISDANSTEIEAEKIEIIENASDNRATSLKWIDVDNTQLMPCSTIIHETFHHLGLQDEYPETALGFKIDQDKQAVVSVETEPDKNATLYNCRIQSPRNSIMAFPQEALKEKFIFYPAQIRLITNYGCTHKYRNYNLCAKEAYKTSLEHYGDSLRCNPSLPKECQHGSDAWLQ